MDLVKEQIHENNTPPPPAPAPAPLALPIPATAAQEPWASFPALSYNFIENGFVHDS
jgi:hypothetical protein